jgi:hypothetical protein
VIALALGTTFAVAPAANAKARIATIAFQGPLTGEEAQVGIDELNGVKYAVALFNAKNKGKIQVNIVEVDDQGSGTEAAKVAPEALLASRTNVLFSIPMLFFMGASRHLGLNIPDDFSPATVLMVVTLLILALELNALKGKLGPMATVRGVIHCGVGLLVVLYTLIEVLV